MFPSIPTFVTLSALRIFSLLVPHGTCGQTFFLVPLPAAVQGDMPCTPYIAELVSSRVIAEAEVVLQLSSPADWALYTAPLGSYTWDSCPYLRGVTDKAAAYARHTGSALRQILYAPRSAVTKELSVVPVFARPPGCWSDDHKVTLEWLGISLPFLALPAPEPVLTLPAPARLLTLPAPARILTLPAPAPVLALPAPPPVLTLPAPARVLALPAPALVLTLPAPAPVLTLPAPARVLTLSAPPLVLTLPAPARILTLPAPAPVLTLPAPPPSLDVSRFKGQLVVRFLRFEWRNIASGACILALTLLPHFLARLLFGGRNRYRMTANSFPVEAVPAKCELGYTDPFDGLDLNIVWIPPTRGHLGGLAPDLFRLAGNSLEADWIDTSVKLQDDNMDAVVQELPQAQVITTMDDPVDDRREVVDSLDGNNHPLDGPLENRLDELLDSDTQSSVPNLEKLEVLPINDIVDQPAVAAEAADDQEGWTVVQSRSRRRKTPAVEAPGTESSRPQDGRGARNKGGSRGGRNVEKSVKESGGRSGGRNGGKKNSGRNEGSGGVKGEAGGRTDNGNRSNGSPGADNWRRRSGGGQNEGGRSEGGAQRPPADIAFQRRLHRRSAAANN